MQEANCHGNLIILFTVIVMMTVGMTKVLSFCFKPYRRKHYTNCLISKEYPGALKYTKGGDSPQKFCQVGFDRGEYIRQKVSECLRRLKI